MFRLVFLCTIVWQLVFAGPTFKYGYIPNSPENSKKSCTKKSKCCGNYFDTFYIVALLKAGNYKQNTEELSGQFEGDMVLNYEQAKSIFGKDRTGLVDTKYRWTSNTIPYILTDKFSDEQKAYIRSGLDRLEAVSCLKFVPKTTEIDFVDVTVIYELHAQFI